jgi:ribonuclease HII
MSSRLDAFERFFLQRGLPRVAGMDEVGRGPLAGPVVASCVLLPCGYSNPSIRDSKELTPKARLKLYWEIASCARIGIGLVDEKEIDRLNILRASLLAMKLALLSLSVTPDVILIDGSYTLDGIPVEQVAITGGDKKSISIAAASIVAKVTRDHLMERYDSKFPQYGFARHKGYPTPEHLSSLERFGPSEIHRMSFRPVSNMESVSQ